MLPNDLITPKEEERMKDAKYIFLGYLIYIGAIGLIAAILKLIQYVRQV